MVKINYLSDIGAKRLSLFLKDRIAEEILNKFSPVINCNVTAGEIEECESLYVPKTFTANLIWEKIYENEIARACFELALFYSDYPYAKDILQLLGEYQADGITLNIAALICGKSITENSEEILNSYFLICNILYLKTYCPDLNKTVFVADFSLIHLLSTDSYMPSADIEEYIEIFFSEEERTYFPIWNTSVFDNIFSSGNTIGVVYGEKDSGRKSFLTNLAYENECNMIIVNYKYFLNSENLKLSILRIVRDCFLLSAVLCISDIFYMNEEDMSEHIKAMDILNSAAYEYFRLKKPMFATAEKGVIISPDSKYICCSFSLPKLSPAESEAVWNEFSEIIDADEDNAFGDISQRIIMPAGKIYKAACSAVLQDACNDKQKIAEICYNLLESKSFKGVTKIYPQFTWDDLILPPGEKDTLHQICEYVRSKNIIMEKWGMARAYQYGSCASALFTGPPGTGKTMSAHVIANALNLILYKVDLSQIMDKYIGETEKHLNNIFDYAENSNAVLFLDEADALIGKRSEVSESKDKYANAQVSYLLQKIEDFNGIVLMATNFSNNIDSAIMRRIRYVVNFRMPDSSIREEMWRSLINGDVPHEDIDFRLISSDEFEFSGAMIKNIVINSAVMAFSQHSPITMRHIALSIRNEYSKLSRTILPQALQQYLH